MARSDSNTIFQSFSCSAPKSRTARVLCMLKAEGVTETASFTSPEIRLSSMGEPLPIR